MRTVGMTRYLHLLPGRKLGIELLEEFVRLGLELGDLVGDVNGAVVTEVTQVLDLSFQLGEWFFEIDKIMHRAFPEVESIA
jgi:hypothetical protein